LFLFLRPPAGIAKSQIIPLLIRLSAETICGIIFRLKMVTPIRGLGLDTRNQAKSELALGARILGEGSMATRSWSEDRAKKRIDANIDALPLQGIEIKKYVRDTDLTNILGHIAYRVNGAQLYADILNLNDMLHVTAVEGETCHRRTLRFLNMH
jgi:hypothetical protein